MSHQDQAERERILRAFDEGRAILCRCSFGFGVRVYEQDDGYARIEINPNPREIQGLAEAEYMQRVVAAWGKRLQDYALKPKPKSKT